MLISGITGGSKTVSSQMIVNQILDNNVDISICDFKAGGDWDNIVPTYAEYTECDDLLRKFYNSFVDTIRNKGYDEKYLLFDEFSSYALSKDTKQIKEIMSMVSHIAFMGRSFGYHLIFMGMTKFQEVAKYAKACYKIVQLVLVNTEILDKYLETFHITDSEFYK